MNKIAKDFLEVTSAQLLNNANIEAFITGETYLDGKKFSFKDHEYQPYIVRLIQDNPGFEIIIFKASQMGISELVYRIVLARMAIQARTSALLSFPNVKMSNEVFKTRWDTIIDESPRLSALLNHNVDSASTKMFLNASIAYALSGNPNSSSNLLTRPISDVVIDELDRQSPSVYNSFQSRTKHTPISKRLTVKISTPTIEGIGIDAEFEECREQHRPLTICEHCGHEFEPDFFKHAKIPGYDGKMENLNKSAAAALDLNESYLECPECKGHCDKRDYRWTVTINPEGVAGKIGVALNPFIAPGFIPISDLTKSFITFDDFDEFVQQMLGKASKSSKASIPIESIRFQHEEDTSGQYIAGIDMGKICHVMEGVLRYDRTIHATQIHLVKLADFDDFMDDFVKGRNFHAMVMDAQPYSDKVYSLVRKHPRLYSAIYEDKCPRPPELFTLKMKDKYDEVVRQVNINKSVLMDLVAESLPFLYTFAPGPYDQHLVNHIRDMKRIRDYRFEEMVYKWVKSQKGQDHLWHSLCYLHMASRLAAAGVNKAVNLPFTIKKMKLKH